MGGRFYLRGNNYAWRSVAPSQSEPGVVIVDIDDLEDKYPVELPVAWADGLQDLFLISHE